MKYLTSANDSSSHFSLCFPRVHIPVHKWVSETFFSPPTTQKSEYGTLDLCKLYFPFILLFLSLSFCLLRVYITVHRLVSEAIFSRHLTQRSIHETLDLCNSSIFFHFSLFFLLSPHHSSKISFWGIFCTSHNSEIRTWNTWPLQTLIFLPFLSIFPEFISHFKN